MRLRDLPLDQMQIDLIAATTVGRNGAVRSDNSRPPLLQPRDLRQRVIVGGASALSILWRSAPRASAPESRSSVVLSLNRQLHFARTLKLIQQFPNRAGHAHGFVGSVPNPSSRL